MKGRYGPWPRQSHPLENLLSFSGLSGRRAWLRRAAAMLVSPARRKAVITSCAGRPSRVGPLRGADLGSVFVAGDVADPCRLSSINQ
jgi:hypothetical protein